MGRRAGVNYAPAETGTRATAIRMQSCGMLQESQLGIFLDECDRYGCRGGPFSPHRAGLMDVRRTVLCLQERILTSEVHVQDVKAVLQVLNEQCSWSSIGLVHKGTCHELVCKSKRNNLNKI